MKLALITDQHFGARNDSLLFSDYFEKFYTEIWFPYILKNNINTAICLGDTFDRRKYINYVSFDKSREMLFDPMFQRNIDFHMIVGNHDTSYKNINFPNSPELLLGNYPNITIYPEPTVVEFDDVPIQFIPWINSGNYDKSMEALKTSPAQILMGHLEISGFEMYKGFASIDGDFKKELLSRFDIVFSGHFHHKSDDGQIFYLGTPYEITWNDWNDSRGFHIFDTETRELERIVNPYSIFKKIYYDDTHPSFGEDIDMASFKDKYVKLIVVNKKDLYKFDMFVDNLFKADAFDVKIIEDFSDLDASNVSDDIVNNTEDTITLLDRYIDELPLMLDKGRLKNTMKTLYNEAQDLEL